VVEILVKRDEIRSQAKDMLNRSLNRYGLIVDDIYISNITFSKDYQDAIERKQTAQQNVEAERQILAQKEIQAQQVVIDARGKADARVASADGEAKANTAVTASISPQLIEYLRWTRWDGKLPLVVGEGQPLLNVPITPTDAATSAATTPADASAPSPRPTPSTIAPRPSPTPR
jgi:regulator of protease activity HflC (stomatin/prohibitin superfamily)